MKVLEIFSSIQGEGRWMGLPVTFIRTAGCNLACPWCDTKESWSASKAKSMSPEEVVLAVKAQAGERKHVVLTGGEPTIQEDFDDVCLALSTAGFEVHIETNGTNPIHRPGKFWITVSPKPQSKYVINTGAIDEIKYIVDDSVTKDTILESIFSLVSIRDMYNLIHKMPIIWLHPNSEDMKHNWERCVKLADELEGSSYMLSGVIQVGCQLHKIIGVQ